MPIDDRVRENVQKLISAGVAESDIDTYMQSEGIGGTAPQVAPELEKKPGFLSRSYQDIKKRGSNISQEVNAPSDLWRETDSPLSDISRGLPEKALRVAGQVAGGINDVAGEGIKSAYNTVMPDKAKEGIGKGLNWLMQTPPGKAVTSGAQAVGGVVDKARKAYPNASKDIDALANILTVIPVGKAAKAVGGEAVDVGKDVANLALRKSPETIEKQIGGVIEKGINKGIRPGVSGKSTYKSRTGFNDKADDAVRSIVKNKDELRLTDDMGDAVKGVPKTLDQMAQAVDQRKDIVFKQYDDIAEQSGKPINVTPLSDELVAIANDRSVLTHSPDVAKYADDYAKRISTTPSLSASEIQKDLKIVNQRLKGKNYSPSEEAKLYVDQLVAGHYRKALDDALDGYADLKKEYGSLKSIEADINRREVIAGRANPKSLVDFSDIPTSAMVIHGIMTGNPATMAAGVTSKIASKIIKEGNKPDNIVNKMFKQVEKLEGKKALASQPFQPQSKTGDALKRLLFKEKTSPVAPKVYHDYEPDFTMRGPQQQLPPAQKKLPAPEAGAPVREYTKASDPVGTLSATSRNDIAASQAIIADRASNITQPRMYSTNTGPAILGKNMPFDIGPNQGFKFHGAVKDDVPLGAQRLLPPPKQDIISTKHGVSLTPDDISTLYEAGKISPNDVLLLKQLLGMQP